MDDLIARWVAGDAAAGEELYRRYYHRVKEFIIKRGAHIVDAEDVAQEALIAGLDGLKAGLKPPSGFPVKFAGNKEINDQVKQGGMDPNKGLTLEEACDWFTWVWDNYESDDYFSTYRRQKGREWADEDLKAMLKFLTRKTSPGGNASVSVGHSCSASSVLSADSKIGPASSVLPACISVAASSTSA